MISRSQPTRPAHLFAALGAVLIAGGLPVAPDAPVADAAQRHDVAAVERLLKQGEDVNAAQGDGMTALHWAAEHGDAGLARTLISAGANLEAVTRLGSYTPLHIAGEGGHGPVVAALLEAGANAGARTTTGGATPLHLAAAAGQPDAIGALLDHGAEIDARETAWGQTPLMFAASRDRIEAVRTLLARGADPSITSRVIDMRARQQEDRAARIRRDQVLTAMARAAGQAPEAYRPTTREVQAAVRAAREIAAEPPAEAVDDSVDYEERQPSPLSYADLVGHQGGLTPLLHAVREGHPATTLTLLDGGADINQVSAGDHTSPILMAMINGHFDLGLTLLERGADPSLANDAGNTPLYATLNTHWAPKARYPQQLAYQQQQATYLDVMEALLEAGVDPNVRLEKHLWHMEYTFAQLDVDTQGATPFWRAAYATDVAAMKLLVAHGADPNLATVKVPERRFRRGGPEPDQSGLPPVPVGGPAVYPIHAASGVGYGEGFAGNSHRHVPDGWLPAVKYLVEELGADVNARDLNGYTPLHHAAARGDNELILYLVEKGADVTAVSRRGQTTADMANGPVQRIQPFPETVALLEKLGSHNNHNCVSCE